MERYGLDRPHNRCANAGGRAAVVQGHRQARFAVGSGGQAPRGPSAERRRDQGVHDDRRSLRVRVERARVRGAVLRGADAGDRGTRGRDGAPRGRGRVHRRRSRERDPPPAGRGQPAPRGRAGADPRDRRRAAHPDPDRALHPARAPRRRERPARQPTRSNRTRERAERHDRLFESRASGSGGFERNLIDHVNNLKLQHLVELSKLGDGCVGIEAELERWLAEHDVVFDGHTIPFVLMPHFVSPGQVRRVRRAVESLCAVLNRFCEAYPEDGRLQEELGLPTFEDSLVRVDPGYPRPLRICRLDAFLAGDTVKFLEFNADSPAGIGYTDVLHEGLRQTIALPRVDGEFDTAYEPMLPVLIETLRDAYRAMREGRREGPELPETPRLALVDLPDSPSVPEFRIICAAAGEAGIEEDTATTDQLAYDGSVLRAGGEPVHLVYRRALIDDLSEGDLTAAYRDGAVCLVNPPRARVANNKKLMALLDDPRFAHLVESREAEVIAATLPWTRILRPGRVTYGEWVVDLLDFVSDNRARLVLKPASEYGGHDVALGIETEL